MRQSPFDTRRSAIMVLLIINLAVFLLELIFDRFSAFPFHRYFALSLQGLQSGYVWQVFTFQFMHADWLHLLFNCWAIYVFGRDVEEVVGSAKLTAFFLASGVIGGLFQIGFALTFGGGFAASVVGASAGAFGLAAAFSLLFPDRILLLFFIIPVKAKYLLYLSVVVAVLGMFSKNSQIAHAAHYGGMLTGLIFVKYAMHWEWRWPAWATVRRQRATRLVKVVPGNAGFKAKPINTEDLPPAEFLSREVDPILDKISAQGIQSLTDRERRILEAAREKMARR